MKSRKLCCNVLLAVVLTCCSIPAGAELLGSMPSGSDIYVTFSPDAIGIDRILNMLASSPVADDGDLDQMREAIGFDPLDWSEWERTLRLVPGGEIGILVENGQFDVGLIGLFLPGTDTEAVQEFFTMITSSSDFRGSLKFREMDGAQVVLMAEDPDRIASFGYGYGRLEDTIDFMPIEGVPVAGVYLDLADMTGSEDLQSALFQSAMDGSLLHMGLAVRYTDRDVLRLTSLLADEAGSTEFGVPEGTDGTLRISFDMTALETLLSEEGISRDMAAGLESLGFPFPNFLALFSGDAFLSVSDSNGRLAGMIQIGLGDPEQAEALLALISLVLNGTEGPSITPYDLDGTTCFRVPAPVTPDIRSVEYGVFDSKLVVALGCSLQDPIEWTRYDDYLSEEGLGIGGSHALTGTASSELLITMAGMGRGVSGPLGIQIPDFQRVAGAVTVEDGMISIEAMVETSADGPAPFISELLGSFLLGALFGYQAAF